MQLNSTSDFRFAAILAVSCLAGMGTATADGAQLQRVGVQPARVPLGTARQGARARVDGQTLITQGVESPTRETTAQEHLIADVRMLASVQANWDGEGASAPNKASVIAASNLVCLLGEGDELPAPMLHASGNAALVWSGDEDYGEIEFLTGSSLAYYFSRNGSKHKGVIAFDSKAMPEVLRVLISG